MPLQGERFDRASDGEAYRPESRALDPRTIIIQPGWNVRDVTTTEAKEHIASIKANILARVNEDPPLPGLIKPIEVRYDRKTGVTALVDGQCRLMACRELWDAGEHIYVPCKVLEGNDEQLFAASLSSNGGKPLTQWEIGIGCRKLHVGYGWSVDRIAAHICKPRRYVSEAIALSNVSVDAKAMLAAGEVTPGAVLHAIKDHQGDQQAAASDLKKRVEAKRPAQKMLTGKTKPVPVARPKKPSANALITGRAKTLLDLADAMCRLILDPKISRDELKLAAEAYREAREK
jgi:ParB-like chromosome segregation protein Spo0J